MGLTAGLNALRPANGTDRREGNPALGGVAVPVRRWATVPRDMTAANGPARGPRGDQGATKSAARSATLGL